jgi:glutamate-1-semialdehyde 2,1-aminomutase
MATATETIEQLYRRRTPGSAKLAKRALSVFPSGVTHDSRHLEPYPLYVERAMGSHKWDVDGNEYVDYAGGHGALLLGHNAPAVVDAVREQLAKGTHFGSSHELEIRWGELVQRLMPSVERLRFTASGTEATMLALRLARAFTGKPKVLRFRGHFHGWNDHMAFGVTNHFDGTPGAGVLRGVADETVLADANDVSQVEQILGRGDVAAVIIEPTGASWGQVPVVPEFLHALRRATQERGVLLVFDEVISGFRCAPGGAQDVYGITPDLTTLAKIVAGGLPGGAVGGRAGSARSGREKVSHHGTFNANPLSAAAGIATLEIIASTDACQRANDFARRLRDALNTVLREEEMPWIVYGTFSSFHIFTNPGKLPIAAADLDAGRYDYRTLKAVEKSTTNLLRLGMLAHGVEFFSWPGGPTSAVHSDADLAQTVDAFRATLRLLAPAIAG